MVELYFQFAHIVLILNAVQQRLEVVPEGVGVKMESGLVVSSATVSGPLEVGPGAVSEVLQSDLPLHEVFNIKEFYAGVTGGLLT